MTQNRLIDAQRQPKPYIFGNERAWFHSSRHRYDYDSCLDYCYLILHHSLATTATTLETFVNIDNLDTLAWWNLNTQKYGDTTGFPHRLKSNYYSFGSFLSNSAVRSYNLWLYSSDQVNRFYFSKAVSSSSSNIKMTYKFIAMIVWTLHLTMFKLSVCNTCQCLHR